MDKPEGNMGKEQTVVPPEVSQEIARAQEEVAREVATPAAEVVADGAQVSLLAALGKHYGDYLGKRMGIMWKDVKAVGAGVLSALPLLGEGYAGLNIIQKGKAFGTTAKAAKEAGTKNPFKLLKAGFGGVKEAKKAQQLANIAKIPEANIAAKFAKKLPTKEANLRAYAHAQELDKGILGRLNMRFALRRMEKKLWRKTRAQEMIKILNTKGLSRRSASNLQKLEAWGKARGRIAKDAFFLNLRSPAYREFLAHPQAPGVVAHTVTGAEISGLDSEGKLRRGVGKVLTFLDSTPDVPPLVSTATFGAEMVGLHGAGIVPATWQFIRNRWESTKLDLDTYKKMFGEVRTAWDRKMAKTKSEDVAQAAEVFVSKTDKVIGVRTAQPVPAG